jgi:hypothetical protein
MQATNSSLAVPCPPRDSRKRSAAGLAYERVQNDAYHAQASLRPWTFSCPLPMIDRPADGWVDWQFAGSRGVKEGQRCEMLPRPTSFALISSSVISVTSFELVLSNLLIFTTLFGEARASSCTKAALERVNATARWTSLFIIDRRKPSVRSNTLPVSTAITEHQPVPGYLDNSSDLLAGR